METSLLDPSPYQYFIQLQKQLSRGVIKKRCSENMQQTYRRTPMPKCDFNEVAKHNTFSLENLWTAASAAPPFQSYVPF